MPQQTTQLMSVTLDQREAVGCESLHLQIWFWPNLKPGSKKVDLNAKWKKVRYVLQSTNWLQLLSLGDIIQWNGSNCRCQSCHLSVEPAWIQLPFKHFLWGLCQVLSCRGTMAWTDILTAFGFLHHSFGIWKETVWLHVQDTIPMKSLLFPTTLNQITNAALKCLLPILFFYQLVEFLAFLVQPET